MTFRRRKSRSARIADVLGTYLKLKAASKAAKGARKVAKGTAAYKVAKRTPMVKRLPLVAGAGAAAFVASRMVKGSGSGGAAA
jgi:uroporphyrinogen-III decarboxylase